MTRTGPADVVMSACDRIAYGRPVIGRPGFREPGSGWPSCRELAFNRIVFPDSASRQPRPTGRSGRFRPVGPPLGSQRVRLARPPHPPCPRSPAFVHPLYWYLLRWHTAPLYGWSFDPGRDVLWILISLRWLQLP